MNCLQPWSDIGSKPNKKNKRDL